MRVCSVTVKTSPLEFQKAGLGLGMAAFVLVHGHMHGAWCWDKVVPLLEAQGHRVVTPELPGRGTDTTPHVELTLKRYTDSVASIVRAMDEPVILVGHSAGGTVLSELAELMPEKMRRHWFFNWQNTITNHDTHHRKFNCNYGNYFLIWDMLMDTLDKKQKTALKKETIKAGGNKIEGTHITQ